MISSNAINFFNSLNRGNFVSVVFEKMEKVMDLKMDKTLYLVLTSAYNPERNPLEIAEEACRGGIDILQIREKNRPTEEIIALGQDLKAICKKYNTTFIVNDSPELAVALDADGVHLGQEDIVEHGLTKTRAILGEDKIIGLSTHSLEQFALANECAFDYLAFGPVFETQTKNYFIGTDEIIEVLKIAKKPVVFIGGVKEHNIDELLKLGCSNIAAIREIMCASDIENKTKILKNKILNYSK